jgi:predicted secreted hydrolase
VEWRLAVHALDLQLDIRPRLRQQELAADPFAYWEGAIRASGTRNAKSVEAVGYLEMTGYAGRVVGLQAPGK